MLTLLDVVLIVSFFSLSIWGSYHIALAIARQAKKLNTYAGKLLKRQHVSAKPVKA